MLEAKYRAVLFSEAARLSVAGDSEFAMEHQIDKTDSIHSTWRTDMISQPASCQLDVSKQKTVESMSLVRQVARWLSLTDYYV